MGLSALDCPRCSRWDDDGEYPTYHGSRAIEDKNGREWTDICDKCFKEIEEAGGKVFYMKEVVTYVKVYGKDKSVEYGSTIEPCPFCKRKIVGIEGRYHPQGCAERP